MEAIGVFSSCVTALIKASCCSLRRISRIRKVVLSTTPKISTMKKMIPRISSASSVRLRMIQPKLRAIESTTRHTASVMKHTIDFRRRALTRMALILSIRGNLCVSVTGDFLWQTNSLGDEQNQPQDSRRSRKQTRNHCQRSHRDCVQRPACNRGREGPDQHFTRTIAGRHSATQVVRHQTHEQRLLNCKLGAQK